MYFIIAFALTDIIFDFVGSLRFEKHVQTFNIQDLTVNFKKSFNDLPIAPSFTTVIEKSFPFISFIQQNESMETTFIKHNTVQSLHFAMENTFGFFLKKRKEMNSVSLIHLKFDF